MKLNFNLLGIVSPALDNFNAVLDAWNAQPILAGTWRLFDLKYPVGTHTILHGLRFKPLDVIALHVSGGGTVSFNYANFTETTCSFTIATAETRVRFLLGKAE